MSRGSLTAVRWAMVAVGLVLAAVLLVRGSIVVGGLIAALAVLRIVVLVQVSRRRRALQDRFAAAGRVPGGRPGLDAAAVREAGGRPGLARLSEGGIDAAARTIGMSGADLRADRAAGRSIAEVASARGVAPERVVDAVVADAAARIDRAVAAGMVPSGRAQRGRKRLRTWAGRLIESRSAPLAR